MVTLVKFNSKNQTGARKSLIEKFGAIPTRSRRCDGEQLCNLPLGTIPGKAQRSDEPKSEELPE